VTDERTDKAEGIQNSNIATAIKKSWHATVLTLTDDGWTNTGNQRIAGPGDIHNNEWL